MQGLNYAVSPTDVCADEFVLATELACSKLKQAEAVQLWSKVANILTSSNSPKSNLRMNVKQSKNWRKLITSWFYQQTKAEPLL